MSDEALHFTMDTVYTVDSIDKRVVADRKDTAPADRLKHHRLLGFGGCRAIPAVRRINAVFVFPLVRSGAFFFVGAHGCDKSGILFSLTLTCAVTSWHMSCYVVSRCYVIFMLYCARCYVMLFNILLGWVGLCCVLSSYVMRL